MKAGQLGGELYPADKIPALIKYLDRRGIYFHESVNGSFDGVRGVMTLPRNRTVLNVRHELSHMLDFLKYGDDYYRIFNQFQREQMVLERLKNNRIWNKLNDAEREWSLHYPSTRLGR
ncbi:MAG: zincin-like metallopeptidase toxin domain-containing protein [Planctomycetota bacterium]